MTPGNMVSAAVKSAIGVRGNLQTKMVFEQFNYRLATLKGNHVNRIRKLSRASTLAASTALTILTTGTALASDELDVKSLVEKLVADMNKGDLKSVVAACAPHAAVVDGFPPYAWPTCADWMNDYKKNNEATHAPLGTLSIGGPKYKEFNGYRAYVIYPVTFANTQSGKSVVYKGTWTMTLLRAKSGWEVTGSASAFSENNL